MSISLQKFASRAVTAARMFEASLYLGGAFVVCLIILWLLVLFGADWLALIFDAVLAFYAASLTVKACEIYAASNQPERPDERQRYLDSRMLHNPDRRERQGRRQGGDRR